jgi:hypothetical protein
MSDDDAEASSDAEDGDEEGPPAPGDIQIGLFRDFVDWKGLVLIEPTAQTHNPHELSEYEKETHQPVDHAGVWPQAVVREVAKRCAVANSEDQVGHVSEEVLKRYISSVENWKGNNPWLSTYKSHFLAMRERGITYEQAQSHLSNGDHTWYLQQA